MREMREGWHNKNETNINHLESNTHTDIYIKSSSISVTRKMIGVLVSFCT